MNRQDVVRILMLGVCLSFSQATLSKAEDSVHIALTPSQALNKISKILKNKGVTTLPSTSTLVSSSSSSSSTKSTLRSLDFSAESVSGTPPTLIQIPNNTIKDLFWRSGVVDAIAGNTPSTLQCSEFFAGDTDGYSGGLGACHMAEGVGHAFQILLESERSLCYMKNLPTKANLKSGGIVLEKGKFPNRNVTELFAPGAKDRLIKINTAPVHENDPTESIYVQVPSKTSNRKTNYLYQATLYFCPEGKDKARGFNIVEVSDAGLVKLILGDVSDPFNGGGSHSLTVDGYITPSSGNIIWDPSKSRNAVLDSVQSTNLFKSAFEITADNLIYLKNKDSFSVRANLDNARKLYAISHFSGSSINDVAFLEGGYEGEEVLGNHTRTFSGAAEYRDFYYASAPSNALYALASTYDMSQDTFYSVTPMVMVDTSAYHCDAVPDIELTMVNNNTLKQSLQSCVHDDFKNMEFCRNDPIVQQAEQNFHDICIQPTPPNGGQGPTGPQPGGQPPGPGGARQ